jgi:IclR family pca regulon transcriptional regulator
MRTLVRGAAVPSCVGVVAMSRITDRDFVQSLERGLAVLQTFSRERPSLTLSQAAELSGLTRATARRILLTLERLGYVRSEGRHFVLTPRVLRIGYAYLSSLDLWEVAEPSMEALAERTKESCSAATLDGTELVYVARVPAKRVMAVALTVGSRLPAHPTSMGRVLLAELAPDALDAYFARAQLRRLTERTVTDQGQLREVLAQVREQGWALVDQELEEGVRSIAAPIRGGQCRVVAAINVSGHAGRVSLGQLRDEFLPSLLETAKQISEDFGRR